MHPAFPVPSFQEGRDDASLGRETRRGKAEVCVKIMLVIPEAAWRLSGIHFSTLGCGEMDSGFDASHRPGMTEA